MRASAGDLPKQLPDSDPRIAAIGLERARTIGAPVIVLGITASFALSIPSGIPLTLPVLVGNILHLTLGTLGWLALARGRIPLHRAHAASTLVWLLAPSTTLTTMLFTHQRSLTFPLLLELALASAVLVSRRWLIGSTAFVALAWTPLILRDGGDQLGIQLASVGSLVVCVTLIAGRMRWALDTALVHQTAYEQTANQLARQLAERHHLEQERERLREQFLDAERSRAESLAQLDSVFASAPVGLCFVDRDLRYVRINQALASVNCVSIADTVGRTLDEVLPANVAAKLRPLVEHVFATGQPIAGLEAAEPAPDGPGEQRHWLLNLYPVPTVTDPICYVGSVVVDITAQKKAEAARDEFLAMLGHELRNPLSPILTALDLMKLRAGDVAAKERAIIQRQTAHLAHLVDDLLDVSCITRGKLELERRPIELAAVVAKAVEVASPLLEQRRHQLETDLPLQGLLVDADEHRLTQVISNLLVNAAKYTEPAGMVRISARREADDVVLVVRDSGIGIAPAALTSIFDLFVRGPRAPDRAQGGLGLGLAIVKSLVSLHGGTVAARSDGRGRGSEFEVRLPAARGPSSTGLRTLAPVVTPRLEARRILVVDDNRDAAELLAEALAELGHETRVAFDGPSAIALAAEFGPEVALLDIGLPVMDGYELGRRLRTLPGLGHLRLVAITGYGQDADRQRTIDNGFDIHQVKPVETPEVAAALQRLFAAERGAAGNTTGGEADGRSLDVRG